MISSPCFFGSPSKVSIQSRVTEEMATTPLANSEEISEENVFNAMHAKFTVSENKDMVYFDDDRVFKSSGKEEFPGIEASEVFGEVTGISVPTADGKGVYDRGFPLSVRFCFPQDPRAAGRGCRRQQTPTQCRLGSTAGGAQRKAKLVSVQHAFLQPQNRFDVK